MGDPRGDPWVFHGFRGDHNAPMGPPWVSRGSTKGLLWDSHELATKHAQKKCSRTPVGIPWLSRGFCGVLMKKNMGEPWPTHGTTHGPVMVFHGIKMLQWNSRGYPVALPRGFYGTRMK